MIRFSGRPCLAWALFVFIVFCMVVIIPAGAVTTDQVETGLISFDEAGKIAGAALLEFKLSGSPGLESGSWDHAVLGGDPVTIYDLDGEPLFFQYEVLNNGVSAGNIKVGASTVLPSSVASISLLPTYWNLRDAQDMAAEYLSREYPGSRVLSTSIVCYSYPKIGLKATFVQAGRSSPEEIILDVATGQPIEKTGAWSYYGSIPGSSIQANQEQWLQERVIENRVLAEARNQKIQELQEAELQKMGVALSTIPGYSDWIDPRFSSSESGEDDLGKTGASRTLGLVLHPQETGDWCTVATIQMIAQYHGHLYTQDYIAQNTNSVYSGTTTSDEIAFYRNYLGMTDSYSDRTETFEEEKAEIMAFRPFDSSIRSGSYIHARACGGYDDNWGRQNLYIYDPWPVNRGELSWEAFSDVSHYEDVFVKGGSAPEPDPDLVISSISYSPLSPKPGDSVTVTVTVQNQGSGNAGSSIARIYLSTNTIISNSDTNLGDVPIASLSAGQSRTYTTTVTIPSTLDSGTYYLGVIADANGAVTETDETNNNDRFIAISIAGTTTPTPTPTPTPPPARPDLVVSSISCSDTTPNPGQGVTVTVTVKNEGSQYASSSIAKIYLSTNTIISSSDTNLGSVSIPSLSAGQSRTYTTMVTIPPTLASGSYYLGAIADANAAVTEADEANNDKYTQITIANPTTPTPTPTPTPTTSNQPDLVISSISYSPEVPKPGDSVTVTVTVKNEGSQYAGSSIAKLYLSADSVITSSDSYLGSLYVTILLPGQSRTYTKTVTVPSNMYPGWYSLGVIADANSAISEANEANNDDTCIPFRIGQSTPTPTPTWTYYTPTPTPTWTQTPTWTYYTPTPTPTSSNQPDLVISSITTSSTSVKPGDSVSVTVMVKNQGGKYATSNIARLYLSTDSTIGTSDTYLGSIQVVTLFPGQSRTYTRTVSIPSTTSAGHYYVGAIADINSAVTESDETNNAKSVLLTITHTTTTPTWTPTPTTTTSPSSADLVIRSFSCSSSNPNPGETVTVAVTIDNQGGQYAASSIARIYLSPDPTISTSDTSLGSLWVTTLLSGQSRTYTKRVTIPSTLNSGTYYLGVIADINSVVPESDETNNDKAILLTIGGPAPTPTPTWTQTPTWTYYTPTPTWTYYTPTPTTTQPPQSDLPDFVIPSLTLSKTDLSPGDYFTIRAVVENQGERTSHAGTVVVYLSPDSTITRDDRYLTSSMTFFHSSQSMDYSRTTRIPSYIEPGQYYLGLVADGYETIDEANENNNVRYMRINVI